MKTALHRPGRIVSSNHPVIGKKIGEDNLSRFLEDYFLRKPSVLIEELRNREVEDELANLLTHIDKNNHINC